MGNTKGVKWTYDLVKQYILDNSDCQLLSNNYKNMKENLLFLCDCGNKFNANFNNFVFQNKRCCNKCSKIYATQKQSLTFNYVKNFIEVESDSECKLLSDEYINYNSKLLIRCKCGSEFKTDFDSFKNKNKRQCNKCGISLRNNNKRINIEEINEVLNSLGLFLIDDNYENTRGNIHIQSDEGYKFFVPFYRFRNPNYYPSLFNSGNIYTIENIKKWIIFNKKEFTLLSNEYINNSSSLLWECKKCNETWDAPWMSISQDEGCPYCVGKRVGVKNNLLINNPNLCEEWNYINNIYLPDSYTMYSNKKVWWKCKECGWEWITSISHRSNGRGCPKCAESKGEKQLDILLTKYNIPHDKQHSFYNLIGIKGGLLRFDISVFWDKKQTKLRMLIEYDGIFHYEKQYEDDGFETLQIHDKLKDEYCKNNNIPLLRIPYWDFDNIEEILLKELNLKAGDLSA